MCKLFAYINHESKEIPAYLGAKINKALRHLFYVNSYGQTDGSGIMWMEKSGKTDFLKAPLPSPTFIDLKCFNSIRNNLHSKKFVAGHTRYSTVGGNSWENSHPFEYGNYLGIQNGTISNSHKTLVYSKLSPCDVDSASVFWAFNEQGVEDTLKRYEGEGVFMFMNKEDKSFNIVKNHYRTLFKAKISTIDAYIFATDEFVLGWVAERNNLDLEYIQAVEDDTLISYNMDNTISREYMEVPPPAPKTYHSYYGSGYKGNTSNKFNSSASKTITPAVVPSTSGNTYNSTATKEAVNNTSKKDPIPFTLPKKEKEEKKSMTQFPQNDYYVQDCDICMNPIMSQSLAYADDPDSLKCTHLACQHCQKDLEEFTGNKVYAVDFREVLS